MPTSDKQGEGFYVKDGKQQDAAIHGPILDGANDEPFRRQSFEATVAAGIDPLVAARVYGIPISTDDPLSVGLEALSFADRLYAAGVSPSENIEDRREEGMGRIMRDLLKGGRPVTEQARSNLQKLWPHPLPPIERPSGNLPGDAGFDDIGKNR